MANEEQRVQTAISDKTCRLRRALERSSRHDEGIAGALVAIEGYESDQLEQLRDEVNSRIDRLAEEPDPEDVLDEED